MKNFTITYEYISQDKEGIANEQIPALCCEDAIDRFNSEGTDEIKILEVKEVA